MRAVLAAFALLAATASASAEEAVERRHIESLNELAGTIGDGRFGHRLMGRLLLNVDDTTNVYEAHYGLAWRMRERVTMDFTIGYVYADDGPHEGHALMLGIWKEAQFGRWRLRTEQEHLYDGGYRYHGFYAVDYAVGGIHVENRGTEAAAGIQFGSGIGLDPFRVEIRLTHGITDGYPDSSGRFFMALDFR